MRSLLLVSLIAFVGFSCSNNSTSNQNNTHPNKPNSEGLSLMETNCYTCHSPSAPENGRIAPPMIAVKIHYMENFKTEEEFKKAFIDFVNNPSEAKSKMPGAVKKFNLMPKLAFKQKDLELMATYLYNNEVEKPKWFDEHRKNHHKKGGKHKHSKELTPLEKGQQLAMKTKSILGKNLMGAIKANGTANALSFCNEKAILLTDSMANALNASIKRVSDKNRNANNLASQQELDYIIKAKAELASKGEITPQLQETESAYLGYYPITTNKMCMQCHGQVGKQITPEVTQKISTLYPNDKATGYKPNQLRGIWVVEFPK